MQDIKTITDDMSYDETRFGGSCSYNKLNGRVQKIIAVIDCYDYKGLKGSTKIMCDEDMNISYLYKHINKKFGWYDKTFLYYVNGEYLIPFDMSQFICDGFDYYNFIKLYAFNFSCNTCDVTKIMRSLEKELYSEYFWTLIFIKEKTSEYESVMLFSLNSRHDVKYIDEIMKDLFNDNIKISRDNKGNKYENVLLTSENVSNIVKVKSCVIDCEIDNLDIVNKKYSIKEI